MSVEAVVAAEAVVVAEVREVAAGGTHKTPSVEAAVKADKTGKVEAVPQPNKKDIG
jgi:hypothetical protein